MKGIWGLGCWLYPIQFAHKKPHSCIPSLQSLLIGEYGRRTKLRLVCSHMFHSSVIAHPYRRRSSLPREFKYINDTQRSGTCVLEWKYLRYRTQAILDCSARRHPGCEETSFRSHMKQRRLFHQLPMVHSNHINTFLAVLRHQSLEIGVRPLSKVLVPVAKVVVDVKA